jgi:hypothetical protein
MMRCVWVVYAMKIGRWSLYSNSQHERRLSLVAIPKSYLGRGLDRPETPEADNEAGIDFSPTGMFQSSRSQMGFTCQK